MSKIRHSSSVAEALQGREHVVFFASQSSLESGCWKKIFRGKWAEVIPALLAGAKPGMLGQVRTSALARAPFSQLTLCILPDEVSRQLAPSRAQAIGDCAGRAGLKDYGALGILVAVDDPEHHVAAVNAVGRTLSLYSRKSKKKREAPITCAVVDAAGKLLSPPKRAGHTVDATRWAADMVDRPTAELDAESFAAEAERSLKSLKTVTVSHIVGDDLLEAGLGGTHAVGRTAVVAPRLLVMEYEPAVPKGKEPSKGPHVALVGKGVVYDTGGLSLKVGGGMVGMKCDMGGAAAVVGAFQVLARGRYPHRVSCVVPLAENAIGPTAYRPDDIITLHSGKTVEINNTDAEGRLLLGDGVSYASRVLKADFVIDAATLTGAQLVATGKSFASVVTNRAGVETLTVKAGLASGDLATPMPFAPELHLKEFKSEVADLMNSVRDRMNAQVSCAATFVWAHVEETGVPWLHVDLAGPAFPSNRGTGYGVGLLSEICLQLQAEDLES